MAKKLDVSESGIRNENVWKKKKSAQSQKIESEALRVLSVDFNLSENTTHTHGGHVHPSWVFWDFNFTLKIISLCQKI